MKPEYRQIGRIISLTFWFLAASFLLAKDNALSELVTESIIFKLKNYIIERTSRIIDEEYIEALVDDISDEVKQECILDFTYEYEEEVRKFIRDSAYAITSGVRAERIP